MIFISQTMQEILPQLQKSLKTEDSLTFCVLNPDEYEGYAGHSVLINSQSYCYRGYKAWIDLAELLSCKMLTPRLDTYPLVKLTFVKLSIESFHTQHKHQEKYGTSSPFAQIHKMEEPAFYYYYTQALANINIAQRKSILNLGINRGDEFDVIQKSVEKSVYDSMHFVGIDHSQSAITDAKERFKSYKNMYFYTEDINNIAQLGLGKFDTLISIGTLQSPSIAFKTLFMSLVQEYLTENSSIILGFPNSRWIGGEMLYGAKVPHYAMSEMGLLLSDIMFCKKYLQQKKYRVTITGKQYLFLTATKIQK
ncbi:MAG: methyltransferase domain-containing protein [Sulfurovum sp.]|nr:methyltransferase domain-containing protein [Sulfurovum sp.]